jgi:hypothetical protein
MMHEMEGCNKEIMHQLVIKVMSNCYQILFFLKKHQKKNPKSKTQNPNPKSKPKRKLNPKTKPKPKPKTQTPNSRLPLPTPDS